MQAGCAQGRADTRQQRYHHDKAERRQDQHWRNEEIEGDNQSAEQANDPIGTWKAEQCAHAPGKQRECRAFEPEDAGYTSAFRPKCAQNTYFKTPFKHGGGNGTEQAQESDQSYDNGNGVEKHIDDQINALRLRGHLLQSGDLRLDTQATQCTVDLSRQLIHCVFCMIARPYHHHHHRICREPQQIYIHILKRGECFPYPSRHIEIMDNPDDPPGCLCGVLCQRQRIPNLEVQFLRRQITEDNGVGLGSRQPAPGDQMVLVELCLSLQACKQEIALPGAYRPGCSGFDPLHIREGLHLLEHVHVNAGPIFNRPPLSCQVAMKGVRLLIQGIANGTGRDLHGQKHGAGERQSEQRQDRTHAFTEDPAHTQPGGLGNPRQWSSPGSLLAGASAHSIG